MTIRRNQPWGALVDSPPDLHIVPTDRAARQWVAAQRSSARPVGAVGLGGGDLARTMGGGHGGRFPGPVMMAPVDILRIEADDGRVTWAVAHLVARRSWWRGEVYFAMNAQFLGDFDVAPKSHPNDGKVDTLLVEPAMSIRDRLKARRRARSGTHVPHPRLTTQHAATHAVQFTRPLVVWVDGVRWGTATSLAVTVEPDALIVYA